MQKQITKNTEANALTAREIEDFYKVSQVINNSLDLKKTLRIIAINITNLLGGAHSDIFLVEKGGVAKCVYSFGKKAPLNKSYLVKTSLHSQKALKLQAPILVENPLKQKKYDPAMVRFIKKEKICCILYLPIVRNKTNVGFVRIYRKGEGKVDYDSKGVMSLVNQMAVAIENSKMHERINKRKARWQAIFEDSSDGMVITNDSLKIISVNAAFEGIIGKKETSLKGKNLKTLLARDEDIKKLLSDLKDSSCKQGKKIRNEVLLETKDGIIWTTMKISFTDSARDDTPRIIFSFEDITEKKELESSKNEFVSIVSHELRSPLTAMRGYLNLLEKRDFGKLTKKQEHLLVRAVESTERMANLVENILDVSRIDTGKIKLILEPVEITKIISLVVRDLSERLKEKHLKIQVTKDQTTFVLGDKDRLYQIFYNLIENAIKYSFPKGKIKVDFALMTDKVVVKIKDNGVGISASEQKKLFSKFSRIDNTLSVSSGGTGLGLYIVKNLVNAHNGSIRIDSKKDMGATFNVSLPLAKKINLVK